MEAFRLHLQATGTISEFQSAVLLFIYQCLMHLGGVNMRVKTFDKNILLTLFYLSILH